MNKQDMLKIQTCSLRVNVHCEGCKHKIKKKLQKIEGVHEVRIDVEQGKVTVSGNVDPATLIKKLNKAGKHAELWGPHKGTTPTINNMQIGRTQNGGFQAAHQKYESKDVRFLGTNPKSAKLRFPEEEEEDDDFDEFDDEFDEDFGAHHQPPTKGHGPQANKATSNGHLKGKIDSNNGGKSKKGGGMNMVFKGILGKAGGKSPSPTQGKSQYKAANQNGGDKKGYRNGAINEKGAAAAHKNYNDSWSKKMGENFDGGLKMDGKQLQKAFNEMNTKHRGGGGGGGRRNTGLVLGQMGNVEAVGGLHPATATATNLGNFEGNPYIQQYMGHRMMMNQQREDTYMRSQAAMSYGPPPPMTDQYAHIFSDENTSSCTIM